MPKNCRRESFEQACACVERKKWKGGRMHGHFWGGLSSHPPPLPPPLPLLVIMSSHLVSPAIQHVFHKGEAPSMHVWQKNGGGGGRQKFASFIKGLVVFWGGRKDLIVLRSLARSFFFFSSESLSPKVEINKFN